MERFKAEELRQMNEEREKLRKEREKKEREEMALKEPEDGMMSQVQRSMPTLPNKVSGQSPAGPTSILQQKQIAHDKAMLKQKMESKERLYSLMLEKSKNLRLRGNLVLGNDPKFDEKVTALEELVV